MSLIIPVIFEKSGKKKKYKWRTEPIGRTSLTDLRKFVRKKCKVKWFQLEYDDEEEDDCKTDIDCLADLSDAVQEIIKLNKKLKIYVTQINDEETIKEFEEEEKMRQAMQMKEAEEAKQMQLARIEEAKQESKAPTDEEDDAVNYVIRNPLIVSINISQYKNFPPLAGCRRDTQMILDLFINEYKYDLAQTIHNDQNENQFGLQKNEILSIFKTARDKIQSSYESKEDLENIDALIIALSGRGSASNIYAADYDGKEGIIGVIDIKDIFAATGDEYEFPEIPKIMFMDTYSQVTGNVALPSHSMSDWFCFYSNAVGYISYDNSDGGFLMKAVVNVLRQPLCYGDNAQKRQQQWTLEKIKGKIRSEAFKLTKDKKVKKQKFKARQLVDIQETMREGTVKFNKGSFCGEYKQIEQAKNVNVKRDALIISLVIKEYDANQYKVETLLGVERDIQHYAEVLVEQYGYTLVSNIDSAHGEKYGLYMPKKKVEKFLRQCRKKLFNFDTGTIYYDSLFVTIGAHGLEKGIICSDGAVYSYNDIRSLFQCDTKLISIPRIYLIDACRSEVEMKEQQKEQTKIALRGSSRTNSTTLFGTSTGNRVKGAKLAVYLCKCMGDNYKNNHNSNFNDCNKWDNFRQTYRKMDAMITVDTKDDHEQALNMEAHDVRTEDVIFMPNDINNMDRGSKYDNDYLEERWTIKVTKGGNTKSHNAEIVMDYIEKRIIFKYDNQEFVVRKKAFTIGRDEGNVYIRFKFNTDLIQIECKDDKPAKYWFKKISPLSD